MFQIKYLYTLPRCLVCGENTLKPVLDLGEQAPANTLLNTSVDPYMTFPLALNRCTQCGHGQLSHSVKPAFLYQNYAYASGTSATLLKYFDWFADECADFLAPGATVLELGCNDGSLLKRLDDRALFTFGVDPAANLANSQVRMQVGMWPIVTKGRGKGVKDIVGPYGRYDMVIALNVLAHGPDPFPFLNSAASVLTTHGIIVIQVSQAHMLERGELDNIYHEHHSFFTISSMTWLAARVGLTIRSVKEVSVHGGSLVFILSKKHVEDSDMAEFMREGPFLVTTEPPKLGSKRDYDEFAQLAKDRLTETKTILERYRQEGYHIAFIGAAAKTVVFLNALNFKPDSVHDEAPLKVDKWLPGIPLQIEDFEALSEIDQPMLAVISAWNFKQELVDKVKSWRQTKSTKFLTYFPIIEEFD